MVSKECSSEIAEYNLTQKRMTADLALVRCLTKKSMEESYRPRWIASKCIYQTRIQNSGQGRIEECEVSQTVQFLKTQAHWLRIQKRMPIHRECSSRLHLHQG